MPAEATKDSEPMLQRDSVDHVANLGEAMRLLAASQSGRDGEQADSDVLTLNQLFPGALSREGAQQYRENKRFHDVDSNLGVGRSKAIAFPERFHSPRRASAR